MILLTQYDRLSRRVGAGVFGAGFFRVRAGVFRVGAGPLRVGAGPFRVGAGVFRPCPGILLKFS